MNKLNLTIFGSSTALLYYFIIKLAECFYEACKRHN